MSDTEMLNWLDKHGRSCVRGTDVRKWAIEAPDEGCMSLRDAIHSAMESGKYFCSRCGYVGPVQFMHERPNGNGFRCAYYASVIPDETTIIADPVHGRGPHTQGGKRGGAE